MIVQLTTGQIQVCLHRFQGTRFHQPLSEYVTTSHRRVEVRMPAIAWLQLRDELINQVFNVRGQRSGQVPFMMIGAMKRVAKAVADIEAHPALREASLFGSHNLLIPAWRVDLPRWVWSPYPVLGAPFSLLVPDWRRWRSSALTVWEPKPDGLYPQIPHVSEAAALKFGVFHRDRLPQD